MGSAKAIHIKLARAEAKQLGLDGLLAPVFQVQSTPKAGKKSAAASATASAWQAGWNNLLSLLDETVSIRPGYDTAVTEGEFDAALGSTLLLRDGADSAKRVVLLGLGRSNKLTLEALGKAWVAGLKRCLKNKAIDHLGLLLPELPEALSFASVIELAADAIYEATYQSAEAKKPPRERWDVTLLLPHKPTKADEQSLTIGEAMARAKSLSKDLINMPANLKRTTTLVEAAQALAKKPGITVQVESDIAWIEREMPAFFSVARGAVASDPPKFITLHYKPKGGKSKTHLVLVGKSVIFDTGGYQVKPGNSMVTMKGDMAGGATVLATMAALAELQPDIQVSAYLAATPNLIDSHAMIPDSVVKSTCGKRVEIRHTDAEGRLTLIDAVAKAAADTEPDMILTIATLTGAAMRAVGRTIALMGNNVQWRDRVHAAALAVGDPVQTLEVVDEDYENIKSKMDAADLINTNQGENRGAQTAAAFVMSGAPEGLPMVHLDIAGADMTKDEKATGISQKTLIRFVLDVASNPK